MGRRSGRSTVASDAVDICRGQCRRGHRLPTENVTCPPASAVDILPEESVAEKTTFKSE